MRKCLRCQGDMVENCDIKAEGRAYGTIISSGTGIFANRVEKPKVAVCPHCGEISLYVEKTDVFQK